MTKQPLRRAMTWYFAGLMLTGCGALPMDFQTPGERFRAGMRSLERSCASASETVLAGNTACNVLKLRPRDWEHTTFVKVDGQPLTVPQEWVATPEGRFAHSIRLPAPLPADSGYGSNMSNEEYFKHLCEKEAGQFVYKVVDNVEGIYQGRPRERVTRDPYQHLYAIEDPAGIDVDFSGFGKAWSGWIWPKAYKYIENSMTGPVDEAKQSERFHASMRTPAPPGAKISRYVEVGGIDDQFIRREFSSALRSRYGYVWRGIRREMDRELGIAGGELIALDFSTNQVLGVFRYYKRASLTKGILGVAWNQSCPQLLRGNYIPQHHIVGFEFLSAVLRPTIRE